VAGRFGVRPQTIGAWESGKSPPQVRFYEPLARFLGLRTADDVRRLLSHVGPADGADEALPATAEGSPDLEIRLNLSRRIAAGEPLTAATIELFNRLLGDANR
jgi:transcriptional regulator with XRE-family HTH domain